MNCSQILLELERYDVFSHLKLDENGKLALAQALEQILKNYQLKD
uniref:Uncharacterized protein n=1 Tax=Siphoviridae sp. ctamP19 TaxID=2827896 RepID=A0A8S5TND8_9CAUD|nr:MAG TPA: hypothetical protein [Siphoviridae sp. ctamP19]